MLPKQKLQKKSTFKKDYYYYKQKISKMLKSKSKYLKCALRPLSTASTVDAAEIQQFETYSNEWWDKSGPTKALHSMNKLRIPFIRDGLINSGFAKTYPNTPQPLKDVAILDVGCGGGILSEPLTRLGANVTGLDANCSILEIAKAHAKEDNLNITYLNDSLEEHCKNNEGKYDGVVASEIVEHITKKEEFLEACVKCLKPNGSIFVTTMNKTNMANIFGIYFAENVLQLLPKGTHQIDKFVEPHRLQRMLEDKNCKTELIHGMCYNLLTNGWCWSANTAINYGLQAIKLEK